MASNTKCKLQKNSRGLAGHPFKATALKDEGWTSKLGPIYSNNPSSMLSKEHKKCKISKLTFSALLASSFDDFHDMEVFSSDDPVINSAMSPDVTGVLGKEVRLACHITNLGNKTVCEKAYSLIWVMNTLWKEYLKENIVDHFARQLVEGKWNPKMDFQIRLKRLRSLNVPISTCQ